MTEPSYLRCHCEELISNDDGGRAQLQRHYREMRKMTGSDERIRELEAELAEAQARFLDANASGWKARAEKAEALNRADEKRIADLLDTQDLLNAQAVSREARVAELERLIAESNAKIPMPYIGPWDPCQTGDDGAREREAE